MQTARDLGLRSSRPTCATCSPMPRNRCGGCSRAQLFKAAGGLRLSMDDGARVRVEIKIDEAARSATLNSLGRRSGYCGTISMRLFDSSACGVALCRSEHDRRCNPDERRVFAATDWLLRMDRCSTPSTRRPSSRKRNVRTPARASPDALFAAAGFFHPGTMDNHTSAMDGTIQTIAGGSGTGRTMMERVRFRHDDRRLTDPEILETRLPVRLEQFAIRRSSRPGARQGGMGLCARSRYLKPMRADILADQRRLPRGRQGRRRCSGWA